MTTRRVEIEYLKARLLRGLFGHKRKPSQGSNAEAKRVLRARKNGVIATSRAAMAVLASDYASFVEAAARQTQRGFSLVAQQKTSLRQVWLPSFIALGSADVALASITAARSS